MRAASSAWTIRSWRTRAGSPAMPCPIARRATALPDTSCSTTRIREPPPHPPLSPSNPSPLWGEARLRGKPTKEILLMSINRIQPGKRLSAAVVHGDTIYIAGQIASDAATDVKGQTQQILKKFDELLAAAGSNKSKLLSATIWLADMRYFDDMNSVWDSWMDPANPPARATVEARLAAPKYFVEIAGIAAK